MNGEVSIVLSSVILILLCLILLNRFRRDKFSQPDRYPKYSRITEEIERPDSNLKSAPHTYPKQYYPKVPYFQNSLDKVSRPCGDSCGVFGTCEDGKCTINRKDKTVFDIDLKDIHMNTG